MRSTSSCAIVQNRSADLAQSIEINTALWTCLEVFFDFGILKPTEVFQSSAERNLDDFGPKRMPLSD